MTDSFLFLDITFQELKSNNHTPFTLLNHYLSNLLISRINFISQDFLIFL